MNEQTPPLPDISPPLLPPEAPIGAATVRAPGVCGELVQGMLGDSYFLVTCPVDFFARVRVELYRGLSGVAAPPDCAKTAAAVAHTLAHLERADLGARVSVSNPIPRGKGLGSSSADLSAAIAATGLALGVALPPAQIGRLALQVEPTDGVMFPGIALFDHRAGTLVEELGPPLPLEIVALDFGGSVDTLDFNRVDRRAQWQAGSTADRRGFGPGAGGTGPARRPAAGAGRIPQRAGRAAGILQAPPARRGPVRRIGRRRRGQRGPQRRHHRRTAGRYGTARQVGFPAGQGVLPGGRGDSPLAAFGRRRPGGLGIFPRRRGDAGIRLRLKASQATVVPAKAGIQEVPGKERSGYRAFRVPAFAGMTYL